MDKDLIKLEEKMAILQHEMQQMSQEIFAQQKEISELTLEIEKMRLLFKSMQPQSDTSTAQLPKQPEMQQPNFEISYHPKIWVTI